MFVFIVAHFDLSHLMHFSFFALTGAFFPHLAHVGSEALIFCFIDKGNAPGCEGVGDNETAASSKPNRGQIVLAYFGFEIVEVLQILFAS